MYLRELRHKRTDGSVLTPLQPAKNLWDPERKRAQVKIIYNCGRADDEPLACGGGRPVHLSRGYLVAPTVFGNVDNRSTIGREGGAEGLHHLLQTKTVILDGMPCSVSGCEG